MTAVFKSIEDAWRNILKHLRQTTSDEELPTDNEGKSRSNTVFFFLLQMTDRLILLCQTGQAQLNIADEIASMH